MKAVAASIIVLGGAILMLMSAATLTSLQKFKPHEPKARMHLVNGPQRMLVANSIT